MTESGFLHNRNDISGIRKRPAMYIGGTDFFGFVNYLVSAFDFLLEHDATWIEIEVTDRIRLSSDACIPISCDESGKVEPYELIPTMKTIHNHSPNATIINALSDFLHIESVDGKTKTTLKFEQGERKNFQQEPATTSNVSTSLSFNPDYVIFSVREISSSVLHSYCRRTSCLYPGITFRIKSVEVTTEYKSETGIRDLFDSIATPYQILHKPIHVCESSDDLQVEAIFVFHSRSENRIWSFANRGRVPDGGTHETGMTNAISSLYNNLQSHQCMGILAVLAIQYPHVTYEGCIKGRIGNPELIESVASLISLGIEKWVAQNPEEFEHLKAIEHFRFGETW